MMNIPSINNLLWQVKHAVRIVPLKVTNDEIPSSFAEFRGGILEDDGSYTFFTEEDVNKLQHSAPTYEPISKLPPKRFTPNQLAGFDYKPFYYNYREDS